MHQEPHTGASTGGPAPLVRHSRRADWGRAIVLWESDDKRGYQFEDGELRVIAKPYFDLLQPAAKPDPALREQLRKQAAANGHVVEDAAPKVDGKRRSRGPVPILEDQIAVFRSLHPEGFEGAAWAQEARRPVQGRRLKRHRDPAIAEAAEQLSRDALRACIDAGRYADVLARVRDSVLKTDLATTQQLAIFEGLAVDAELAEAMFGYLHDERSGELATMARLRRALARHGVKKIAWNALTAPRALLHPDDHVCVRPSVMRAQAKSSMPGFKLGAQPSADDYTRCLEMVMRIRQSLVEAGLAPRDLFDVTRFCRLTLSASGKAALEEAMRTRLAETHD